MKSNKHDFSLVPSVSFRRSKMTMNHDNKTTFNVGDLVPLDVMEVIPGDTFSTKMTGVIRTTTSFIRPIMDNLYMDVYHFFVPNRLCYENSEKVFGKASPSMYVDEVLDEYPTLPSMIVPSKSVGDYLGLPVNVNIPEGVSVIPFRAFALIYNNWFRNQAVIDETFVQTGERSSTEVPNNNAWSPNNYFGKLPKCGKAKDYFTSALPRPQKGQPVNIALTSGLAPLRWNTENGSLDPQWLKTISSNQFTTLLSTGETSTNYPSYDFAGIFNGITSGQAVVPVVSKFGADVSAVSSVDVNDLRFAFQLQKMLERDSLFGSRYSEFLLAHFGVSSPDSRLQLPEFLGGGRIPITVQQVAQTSQGTEDSPLAQVGAFSLSVGKSSFVKGFVEHGFVITVGCVRQVHTYQQGVPKMWFRKSRNDFYDPLFANLGEQPIYVSEIFANQSTLRGNVLGYNEAWADYRYKPNMVTGQMRSASNSDLDVWHLADIYSNAPSLTDSFINENSQNIDRVLTAPSSSIDNFIMDMYFETDAIRVMPTYSVPGLIDHH